MKEIVLVTEPEFGKGEAVFRSAQDMQCEAAPPGEAALAETVAIRGARAVIVGVEPYQGPLYEALGKRNGAIIARFGVGHDSVNKSLAGQHGIVVTNTPGVLDVSVAEHTLWLMGCLARKTTRLETQMRAGQFAGETGMELRGKKLGILGFGAIGRRVSAIAHFGFGMRVIACARVSPARPPTEDGAERFTTDPEEVFRECDILSVHLSANAGTERFINATRLAWLQPGALLINTARGTVLDEGALYDALVAGRLAGAALDVFEREPYVPADLDKDLRKLRNVVLTPHIGSNTHEANRRMAESALRNVRCFLAGDLDGLARVNQS